MNDDDQNDMRQNQSKAVAKAVTSLSDKLGFEPDVIFEGAIRGACALMLAAGDNPNDVAKLLEQSARLIRTVDQAH